jgi:hypothetical protein
VTIPILIPEAYTVLLVISLITALAGLVLAFAVHRRTSELRQHYDALMTGVDGANLAAAQESYVRRLTSAEVRVGDVENRVGVLDERLSQSIQHFALVRYSAFEDAGGDQSFSLALLNDDADGVVVSGLYGRGGGRAYAKPIVKGGSDYTLTSEEEQAVASASRVAPAD